MKRTFVAILVLGLAKLPVFSADTPITGKLFVALKYDYTYLLEPRLGIIEQFFRSPYNTWELGQKQLLGTGSFWAVQTSDKTILITAAHVLGVNFKVGAIDGHKIDEQIGFIMKVSGKTLVGTLGYEPSEVGFATDLDDAVFLTVKDSRMLKTIKPLVLSDSTPEYGENVQVVGYPGTHYEQHDTLSVTWVQSERFFVLNKAVEDGYSGGVVLNSAGKAYGVIINTDADKQTTVLRVTPDTLKTIDWHPADEVP